MGKRSRSSLIRRVERAAGSYGARLRRSKPDALTSVVLTTPVFVTYHLGILLIDKRNGVDWVSELSLRLLHSSVAAYVLLTLALAAGLSAAAWFLRERGQLRPVSFLPVVAESALWSGVMLVSVGWAVSRLSSALAAAPAQGLDPLEKVVMAAGAGFHEELLFRVVLLSGSLLLLDKLFGARGARAWLAAALLSALAFGLAHHLGHGAPRVSLAALGFRGLAGLFLAAVYTARGFAVAVYTHALYDLLVFFVLS